MGGASASVRATHSELPSGHESATVSAFAEVEDDLLARDLLVLVEQI
jgi:hypothetical protein